MEENLIGGLISVFVEEGKKGDGLNLNVCVQQKGNERDSDGNVHVS